jgi:hypothetical protein
MERDNSLKCPKENSIILTWIQSGQRKTKEDKLPKKVNDMLLK